MSTVFRTEPGVSLPLGVHARGQGFNFAVFSRHAGRIQLQLFHEPEDSTPYETIDLHRSGDIWHVWIGGIGPDQPYGFRAHGPYQPEQGHRFNPHKLLLDPCAKAIASTDNWDFGNARGFDAASPRLDLSPSTEDNAGCMPKCVVCNDHFLEWQGDRLLRRPWTDTVIYKTHVRGLTIHKLVRSARSGHVPRRHRKDSVF